MDHLKYLRLTVFLLFWTKNGSAQFFPSRGIFPSGGNNQLSSVPSLFPVLGSSNDNDHSSGAKPASDPNWPYFSGNGDLRPQQLQQQQFQQQQQNPIQSNPLQTWQQNPAAPQLIQNWQTPTQLNQPFFNPNSAKQDPSQSGGFQPQSPYQNWQPQQQGPQQTRPFYNNPSLKQGDGYNINNNPFYGFPNFFNNPNWYQLQQQQQQQEQQQAPPAAYEGSNNLTPFQQAVQPAPAQQSSGPSLNIQSPSLPFSGDKNNFPFSTLSNKPSSLLSPSQTLQAPYQSQNPTSNNNNEATAPASSPSPSNTLAQPSSPQKPSAFQQGNWAPTNLGQNSNNGGIPSPASPQIPSTPSFDDGSYKPQLYGDGNGMHLFNNSGLSQMTHQQEQIQNSMNNLVGDTRNRFSSPEENELVEGVQAPLENTAGGNPISERTSMDSPSSSFFEAPNSWVYPDD